MSHDKPSRVPPTQLAGPLGQSVASDPIQQTPPSLEPLLHIPETTHSASDVHVPPVLLHAPCIPGGMHVYPWPGLPCTHVSPAGQGSGAAHSSISSAQVVPVHPAAQEQTKEVVGPASAQVPPFSHGEESHGRTSVSHSCPAYPGGQSHEYESIPSTHEPPLTHMLPGQSSMFVSHRIPVKPAAQAHSIALVTGSTAHVPPFWHGEESHGDDGQ